MSSYEKVIVIEVLTTCNLSCPFCAHDSRLKVKRSALDLKVVDDFLTIVGQQCIEQDQSVLISWLGGEPFLYQGLDKVTENSKSKFPLHFSATTNGTRLAAQLANGLVRVRKSVRDHLRENYSELTISIDGPAEFHDTMRGKRGLFGDIKEGVKLLRNEAPALRIRVNVVLMRNNFELFHGLCLELARWGVEEITFNQLGGRDRPEFYEANRLTEAQGAALPGIITDIRHSLRGTGTRLVCSEGYLKRIHASVHNERLPILDCRPGTYYLFVSSSGKIAPCSFTIDEYGVDLASIRSVTDLGLLETQFKRKKSLQQAPSCGDCPCTNVHGKFS